MMAEVDDPLCLASADAVRMLAGAPWARFVVIGDSLSKGMGDPVAGYRHLGWSDRVAEALRAVRPGLDYTNLAEIGATTNRVLEVQVPQVAALRPDLVHVPCGPNDLFRADLDLAQLERDLDVLWAAVADTGALLTAFTLGRAFRNPRIVDWEQRRTLLNATVRRLAVTYDVLLVDMEDHPVNDRDELVSADGIHFSSLGQAVMAAEVSKALARTQTSSHDDARSRVQHSS